jgi:hypothetical protein
MISRPVLRETMTLVPGNFSGKFWAWGNFPSNRKMFTGIMETVHNQFFDAVP